MRYRSSAFSLPLALLGACLALAVTGWLYWPGTAGPDLLDDRTSVMVAGDLRANPEQVWDFILGDRSGLLGRSVSMATFALEKLYLDEGMVGSKKVNILLHLVNGALFMLLCALLFRYQRVPGYVPLAVLLGAVWLMHPLLVSSVLYVVQRMAMLATFFMLLLLLAYVGWRLSLVSGKGGLLRFVPVPLLLVVGLLAKENAVVVVPILLMLEILWFRFEGAGGRPLAWLRAVSYLLVAGGVLVLMLGLAGYYDTLVESFRGRQFSLGERLLTQGRILWDYVGQWFWPNVGRMGLYHDDFALSYSFMRPLTTALAWSAWLLVALLCAVLVRWPAGRWFAFGVSWYLLGHAVESTILPLELYFEHRNYFPAMGLMLALGSVYAGLVRRWPEPAAPLLVILGFCLLPMAALSSSQVQVWSSRPLLVLNHLNGHPASFRANVDMASEMAQQGAVNAAHHFSALAFAASKQPAAQGERWGDYQVRNLALSCIAGVDVPHSQVDGLGTTDPERPLSSVNTLATLVRMIQEGQCEGLDALYFADRMAEIYLVDDYRGLGSSRIFSHLAVLENSLQRFDKALAYIDRYLAIAPGGKRGLLMKLHFTTALGLSAEAQAVAQQLQVMEQQGKLTVAESKTLSLYRKN